MNRKEWRNGKASPLKKTKKKKKAAKKKPATIVELFDDDIPEPATRGSFSNGCGGRSGGGGC
jgi:hypothetical protein